MKRLEAFVTSAWEYANHVHTPIQTLELPLIQTKTRFTWQRTHQQIAENGHLRFSHVNEVGDAAFLNLIQRSSINTLDRVQIETLGAEQHARDYLHLLKTEFEYHPEWWLAAYEEHRAPVGHVIGVPFNLHRHLLRDLLSPTQARSAQEYPGAEEPFQRVKLTLDNDGFVVSNSLRLRNARV